MRRRALTALAAFTLATTALAGCDPLPPKTPSGVAASTADGQTIANAVIDRDFQVRHANVTLRNVTIRGTVWVVSGNVHIDRSLIDCGNASGPAVGYANFKITGGTQFVNCNEGPRMNGNASMVGSAFHSMADSAGTGNHADAIQIGCGSNIVIKDNILIAAGPDFSDAVANAVVMIDEHCGDVSNVLIEGNVMAGGGYVAYGGSPVTEGVIYRNNRISTRVFGPGAPNGACTCNPNGGGWWGVFAATGAGVTVEGNTWLDGPNAGQPIG